ncbi:hypothetical protein V2G26_008194 [Clonostachys chloroleuca]
MYPDQPSSILAILLLPPFSQASEGKIDINYCLAWSEIVTLQIFLLTHTCMCMPRGTSWHFGSRAFQIA